MPSVVSCTPLPNSEYSEGSARRRSRSRRYWLVVIDSMDEGNAYLAATAVDPGNPGYYVLPRGTVDATNGLVVVDRGAFPVDGDDSGLNWIAWSEESSDPIEGSSTSPWLWKDRVHRDFVTYTVPMFLDFSPTPKVIINSAGDMPATPLMMELSNPYLRIARARRPSEFSYKTAGECIGSINQSSFTVKAVAGNITVPAEEAILRRVVADDELWQGNTPPTPFLNIVLEIELKGQYPPTATDTTGEVAKFKHVLIEDKGMHYYATASTPASKTVFPTLTPQFINADGTKVTLSGTWATDAATLATKFRAFQRAPIKDWSSFIL